jgi:hypothetical protein
MRIPSLPGFLCCGLILLGACQSNPSSTPGHHTGGDSVGTGSSRSPVATAIPSPEARDSIREAPQESYDTLDPAIRSHFRDVLAFLEFVRRPNSDYNAGFDEWIKQFRIQNVDSFLNFITADSLEIDDADADRGKDSLKYSRTMLRQQLVRRKGAAFNMIGLIGLHYSMPYPQYSHTTFSVVKADSIPNVNVSFSEFVLYFRAERGSAAYKLYRLQSDHISDL